MDATGRPLRIQVKNGQVKTGTLDQETSPGNPTLAALNTVAKRSWRVTFVSRGMESKEGDETRATDREQPRQPQKRRRK